METSKIELIYHRDSDDIYQVRTSYATLKEDEFIHMSDLQGLYDQLHAIGKGWA